MSALFIQCPGDTVQTGTGKVDQARKFKCTTAAPVEGLKIKETLDFFLSISRDRTIRFNSQGPRSTPKMQRFQPISPFIFPLQSL